MVRTVKRILVATVGALLSAAMSTVVPMGPAQAAPALGAAAAAPKPTPTPKPAAAVAITGEGLTEPLTLHADHQPAHVAAVIDQVSWLGKTGQATAPKDADLGPKYTVVVLAGDVAKQTYDLYPLAKGGPRVYRPTKQPDLRKVTAGWFLGRLNMSETLRTAGVPLPRQLDTVSGGVGGGERVLPEEAINPTADLGDALGDLQHLLLLNLGVVVVITAGLAGIALLIRRRTR